jgi:hypothetical protein
MKIPFLVDADDAISAVQNALAAAENKISALEMERKAKLDSADDNWLVDVARIDRERVSTRAIIGVYQERLIALKRRQRDQDMARRDQLKASGIAEIKKRLVRRRTATEKLEQALKQVAVAFAELDAADIAVFENWSEVLPPAHRLVYCRASIHEALSSRRIIRPMAAGIVRELAERVPLNLVGAIDEKSADLVAELEATPVELPEEEVA